MSCKHVLKKEYIESKEKIIIINNKFKEIEIDLNKRFIKDFEDINLDAIILEIKKKDGIDKNFFLSPDMSYKKGYNNQLINKKFYILQNPSNKSFSYSNGVIKSIDLDENEFTHLDSTEPGSSGSSLFLENNQSVLGMHKAGYKGNYNPESENDGNFIGPIVEALQNNSKPSKSCKTPTISTQKIFERGNFLQKFFTEKIFINPHLLIKNQFLIIKIN